MFTCMTPILLVLSLATLCDAETDYVQPERFIRCPSPDETCYITLTVSTMETLTAYSVTDNGTRGDCGYQVNVNNQGSFDSVLTNSTMGITQLFQPIVADGTTRRNLLVVNDQLPGPTIIGYKNQRVRINVTNNLGKEAITLHWHGQHVNGSSGSQNQYSDGVPFVTQCPILPSESFVYDFQFYPAGTYWYHSHQYDERSNGMYGGLVVLDPNEPNPGYDFDIPEQHTILFFEWFPVNSDSWIEAPYSLPDPVNPSEAYNPVRTYDGTHASFPPFFAGFMNFGGWRFNPSASDCTKSANNSLPFFNVTQGQSYRFRLVGAQVTYAYRFSISGHRLRVIATDGIGATLPENMTDAVDYIIVHVGERYDFVLNATENATNYLMLIETLEVPSMLEERGYCIKAHRGYAVLHYDGASDVLPADFDNSYDPLTRCDSIQCYALNCPFENYPEDLNIQCISVGQLELTSREPVPNNNVTSSVFLNFGFSNGPSINNVNMLFPQSPPLSQIEDIPPDLFCQYSTTQSLLTPSNPSSTAAPSPADPVPDLPLKCIHTYTVEAETETVEFVFLNVGPNSNLSSAEAHPIHLHGHHYFVMDTGYPNYVNGTVSTINSEIDCSFDGGQCNLGVRWSNGSPPPSACEANNTCPLKDTTIVPAGGYVRVRFPADNWGWWIMHCHIEPHLLGGMAMVVNETSVRGHFPIPENFPNCSNFNFNRVTPNSTSSPESTDPPPTIPPMGRVSDQTVELTSYRNATIALGVICCILLLICVVLAIIVVYFWKKTEQTGNKVEEHEMTAKIPMAETKIAENVQATKT